MKIEPCRHCGSTEVTARATITGSAISYFDETGTHVETIDSERKYYNYSRTVRCADCNKIRWDLQYSSDDGIINVLAENQKPFRG